MDDYKPDIKADKMAASKGPDQGELANSMEPLLIAEGSRYRTVLTDLALDLVARSAGLGRSLPEGLLATLSKLVRTVNCYYSNLIEGHDTHPVEIERALKKDYSDDTARRNLQLEAKAHIAVQQWIDEGGLVAQAASMDGICEIHRRFGELLPEVLLQVTDTDTGKRVRVVPGELRHKDVIVGQHVAISPGTLPRFLKRFEEVYSSLGKTDTILAAAAAHHRLLWIHPFLDGNGRVARLMSHAMLLETLDTNGIWSIARGLARNVADYKAHLADCDMRRRNDLDERGNLSEETLGRFTEFFLTTCIDQVSFMEEIVQPNRLRDRILLWTEEEIRAGKLPPKSRQVLEAILYRGQLTRGEIPGLLGTSERHARRITLALVDHEVLTSESTRAPLRLNFSARLASRWMPGLFPEWSE